MDEPWTIAELAERAADTLTAVPPTVRSRRIREAPNERLIRWYATVGLVDPPLSRRGRIALYGRRHLLQLVAIKRRQAEGRSLAEIQAELAGAADKQLEAIAQVAARPSGEEQAGSDPSGPDHGGVTGPGSDGRDAPRPVLGPIGRGAVRRHRSAAGTRRVAGRTPR